MIASLYQSASFVVGFNCSLLRRLHNSGTTAPKGSVNEVGVQPPIAWTRGKAGKRSLSVNRMGSFLCKMAAEYTPTNRELPGTSVDSLSHLSRPRSECGE